MMQQKLGSLVGRSSGYVESLPSNVRRRVTGLKGIQKDHAKLEAEFQEEVLQLEKKYFAKFTPLYEKRANIVNGETEPTEGEVEAGKDEEEDEEAGEEEEEKAADESMKGVPEFWLTAMKNQISLAELITDRDEEALRSLTDIRMEYLDRPGFRLIFEFAPNDFFTNKSISKTYFYREESGYGGDFIYDHAEGDKIDWKAGKDLTVRVESKKQRNKSRGFFKLVSRDITDNVQIPSKPESLKRLSPQSPSSTSLRLQSHLQTRMKLLPTSKKDSSSTINLVKTSRRN
jgi:nucleosome assembly protein 1-like 1